MNADKIFYATWGLVIIFIGISAIIGMFFSLDIFGTFLLWLLCVGAILTVVGSITLTKKRGTALTQIGAGMTLVVIAAGVLAIFLQILNVYVTLAIIIIFLGLGIAALGMSKKR